MTFETIEVSNDEGRPIFLYAFNLGAATWRYTSSDQDLILNGYKWIAEVISDDGVKLSGEASSDPIGITAPSRIAPVALFIGTPPSQPIVVSIYHYHEGDNEAVLGYIGEVLQVDFPEPGSARITCDTFVVSMQRDGLRLGWQRTCPFALYDIGTCNADKTAFAVEAVISEVTQNTITVQGAAFVNNAFNGGFIEWNHPQRGVEARGIEGNIGNVLTIFGLTDGLYYGLGITAYPGCDRTPKTCSDKFDNLPNYGGVPDMPGKSPFDGDPVF